MKRQMTLMALVAAAQAFEIGNLKLSKEINRTAFTPMGHNPIYGPTRSQMRKNKINRLRKQR